MNKRVKKPSFSRIIFPVVFLFFLPFSVYSGKNIPAVYADEWESVSYTEVLDDLKKDEGFNAGDYPEVTGDYSLKAIQIAEGKSGELFIYVYQPSADENIKAASLNLSVSADNSGIKNYGLEYINSDTVFFKYKVTGFTVLSGDVVRYYNIPSIYRAFNADIDGDTGNGNTTEEAAYAVGQLWSAGTVGETVIYKMRFKEVITVTSKYVGFIRYSNGFKLYVSSCDSHFVAFSTDKPIDRLYEADVYFVTREVTDNWAMGAGSWTDYGEEKEYNPLTVNYSETAGSSADGLFANRYAWNRIESVSDFIKNEDLTDEARTQLLDKNWVLRFYESGYSLESYQASRHTSYTAVTGVTILRLKFETDGTVYNLGVVDNKRSGDNVPDNNSTEPDLIKRLTDESARLWNIITAFFKEWWWAFAIAAGGILFIVFFPVLWPVVSAVVKWLVKGLGFIISLPFKGIYKLVQWLAGKFLEAKS